jgi:hypothetical protein
MAYRIKSNVTYGRDNVIGYSHATRDAGNCHGCPDVDHAIMAIQAAMLSFCREVFSLE